MANQSTIQIIIDGDNIKAVNAISGVESKLKGLNANATAGFQQMTSMFKTFAGALGLGFGISELVSFTKQAVFASAELEVLKSSFSGTTEDIELFRKATAGTVSEANLLKLSNQATDLGLTMENQAKLFYLTEQAGDKYGVGLEEAFQKVVLATEGNIKGLKMLGIQKAVFEDTVNKLAAAHGDEIKNLDAETQKMIRMQAVLRATGVTMDDVNNQTVDAKDRFEQLGVAWEETQVSFGGFVRDAAAGWFDMISAFVQGGPIAVGVFESMNNELDIIQRNIKSILEMYREAIRQAGSEAEKNIVGKKPQEIEKLVSDTLAKINALENAARKNGFDAETKNDLEQQKRKLQVYQSTLDLMNLKNKDSFKKLNEEYEKNAEEMTFQNSLFGLTAIEIELVKIEKKYFDERQKFQAAPLFDKSLIKETEIIETLQALMKSAKPPEDFIKKMIKDIGKNTPQPIDFLMDDEALQDRIQKNIEAITTVTDAEMLNYVMQQGYAEEAFGNMAGAMQSFYEAGGQRSRAFFDLYKAFSIAETTISTYKAAANALEAPPVGLGPVWGWALAATVIASGLARVAQIASTQPGGSAGGGGISGGGYTMPQLPSSITNLNNNTQNSNSNQQVTINFYGGNPDDAWWRKNVGYIQNLFKDNLLVINKN